jgi:DNA-binding transcriptional MocR family regulator
MQGIMQYFPEHTKVSRPQGGFVLWIELDKKLNAYLLYREALKHNISVAPGQLFSMSGRFANCLRISYARPWDEDVEQGIKVLGSLVRKMC